MSRADRFSLEAKKQIVYSDFLINFDKNPITGSLARVTNEESVRQSLKTLALTMFGERFYNTNKGSPIPGSMFELYDASTIELLRLQMRALYKNYEPRAVVHDVRLNEGLDSNGYDVTVIFSLINIPDEVYTVAFSINRVR